MVGIEPDTLISKSKILQLLVFTQIKNSENRIPRPNFKIKHGQVTKMTKKMTPPTMLSPSPLLKV